MPTIAKTIEAIRGKFTLFLIQYVFVAITECRAIKNHTRQVGLVSVEI